MSKYHPQVYYDAQSLLKVSLLFPVLLSVLLSSYVLQALAPSKEKLQARRTLRRRIREIIRSYTEQEFDVEDISMCKYAEDVDIAPLDLIIVVRTITH